MSFPLRKLGSQFGYYPRFTGNQKQNKTMQNKKPNQPTTTTTTKTKNKKQKTKPGLESNSSRFTITSIVSSGHVNILIPTQSFYCNFRRKLSLLWKTKHEQRTGRIAILWHFLPAFIYVAIHSLTGMRWHLIRRICLNSLTLCLKRFSLADGTLGPIEKAKMKRA